MAKLKALSIQKIMMLALLALAGFVPAAEWHLQPGGGGGDGRSRAGAWRGFDSIAWGAIKPGDMINIYGEWTNTSENLKPLPIKISGVKDKPVLIRGRGALFSRYYINLDGRSYLTLKGLSLINCGQVRGAGAKWITIKECSFSRLGKENVRLIELRPGNDDWTIKNCVIEQCGNGVYSLYDSGSAADGAQRVTVKNCIFRYIGVDGWPSKDGHAVGLQGGSGHRITGNLIEHCGTAICCWARSVLPMRDIVIADNRIKDCRSLEVAQGGGIEISGSLDVAKGLPRMGWRRNITIARNKIARCEIGISANIREEIKGLASNTITECKKDLRIRNPFEGLTP